MKTLENVATYQHLIDGADQPSADGRTFEVRNPANGALVARVAEGGANEIGRAVEAGRRAFHDGRWSKLPVRERYRILNRFAQLIEDALPSLSTLETTCTG